MSRNAMSLFFGFITTVIYTPAKYAYDLVVGIDGLLSQFNSDIEEHGYLVRCVAI